jgi:hypothetical protein
MVRFADLKCRHPHTWLANLTFDSTCCDAEMITKVSDYQEPAEDVDATLMKAPTGRGNGPGETDAFQVLGHGS